MQLLQQAEASVFSQKNCGGHLAKGRGGGKRQRGGPGLGAGASRGLGPGPQKLRVQASGACGRYLRTYPTPHPIVPI